MGIKESNKVVLNRKIIKESESDEEDDRGLNQLEFFISGLVELAYERKGKYDRKLETSTGFRKNLSYNSISSSSTSSSSENKSKKDLEKSLVWEVNSLICNIFSMISQLNLSVLQSKLHGLISITLELATRVGDPYNQKLKEILFNLDNNIVRDTISQIWSVDEQIDFCFCKKMDEIFPPVG